MRNFYEKILDRLSNHSNALTLILFLILFTNMIAWSFVFILECQEEVYRKPITVHKIWKITNEGVVRK